MKKATIFLLIFIIAIPNGVIYGEDDLDIFDFDAKSYILINQSTNQVLASRNCSEELLMASTTKVMTAIVALELIEDINGYYKVPDEASGVIGSSIYLEEGEIIPIKDLLYGLMIRSGNDSAVALAIATAGSEKHFVKLMNEKAEEIGAFDTSFANPHGLNAKNHYTTAHDLALITAYAMDNPFFREIASTTFYRSTTLEGKVRAFHSNNRFLLNYDKATAAKTGWTTEAGRCLTGASSEGAHDLVGVLLYAPNWFNDLETMMNWAYAEYKGVQVIEEGVSLGLVEVKKGVEPFVAARASKDIVVSASKNTEPVITSDVELNDKVTAPVYKGDKIGEKHIYKDGEYICTLDLVAHKEIAKESKPWYRRFFAWRGETLRGIYQWLIKYGFSL
ncbi:D-alanyl-D-alanine carboxypeptidase family protein [Proteinivorax tanatarense]|uniref:serine-type D-Ala-D-Ala carboxypeptidase n=1 Tax=Proteinivorax tanatarense TaxID=1260629 RepID=A0AAU7VPZ2_9FIRM